MRRDQRGETVKQGCQILLVATYQKDKNIPN
jgi:hypothetical protein